MNEHRERVLQELVNQLRINVEGLEDFQREDLKLDGTFADLGASSLDTVEVVSTMMAKLRVTVDRTVFARVKNIGELVDLFEQQLTAQA